MLVLIFETDCCPIAAIRCRPPSSAEREADPRRLLRSAAVQLSCKYRLDAAVLQEAKCRRPPRTDAVCQDFLRPPRDQPPLPADSRHLATAAVCHELPSSTERPTVELFRARSLPFAKECCRSPIGRLPSVRSSIRRRSLREPIAAVC